MKHILTLEGEDLANLENLFEKIYNRNMLLILGAGASVTDDKRYLSQQLIDYYEAKKNISLGTRDIVEFVDIIEKSNHLSRREFDQYVYDLLSSLKVTETHKIIASIPWREIITTNYDLLIEKAFDEIRGSSEFCLDIVPIKSKKDCLNFVSHDQVRYIKLHGCLSDKTQYKFVFSTADYDSTRKFYRTVLAGLKSPSIDINILSVGYSFSDSFAYSFLKMLDRDEYRDRRWMYNIDPYVNENMLDFFYENRIAVIKLTSKDFFERYRKWEEERYKNKNRVFKSPPIQNKQKQELPLSNRLQFRLNHSLKQLNESYRGNNISEKDFLLGEEPSFDAILNNYDVIKESRVNEIKKFIFNNINGSTSVIPIFCLSGSFGIGKTTDTYRLINTLINDDNLDIVAFEITESSDIKIQDYCDLVIKSQSQYVLFYINNIEIDSVFKSMLGLRADLSMRQLPSNIFFITSVRENILKKHNYNNNYKNLFEYKLPSTFEENEIDEFVSKLQKNELVQFRDVHEKNAIIQKIRTEYKSDPFISLVKLVSNGVHIDNLRDAYFELSPDCKEAFIYTALLHRFSLLMPASLLNQLISRDWSDFKTKVIDVEGRGILIQEEIKAKGLDPDLYFKTKHPIIADLLVKEILKSKDRIFEKYLSIIKRLIPTKTMSRLAINLLKAIKELDEISVGKIHKLYDAAYNVFEDDPYFILNYTINLQSRGSKENLLKALKLLVYAESLLDIRNDRFIHRRGVISFDLARLFFKEETQLNFTFKYLEEAEDILELKQLLDPCSSFGYVDYLKTLIWKLENIYLGKDEELSLRIQIEELYETAITSVSEGLNRIEEAYHTYRERHLSKLNLPQYLKELDDLYNNQETRPYACILKFKIFEEKNIHLEEQQELLEELENYTYNNEVAKFLFKFYSKRLNYLTYRMKFLDLVKIVNKLKEFKSLMYDYYMYIAEAYNRNFQYAFEHLKDIDKTYNYLNPDFQQTWKDPDSVVDRIFSGVIVKHKGYYCFKSYDLQYRFSLKKCDKKFLNEGLKVNCYLHFYFTSIRAEIISEITD